MDQADVHWYRGIQCKRTMLIRSKMACRSAMHRHQSSQTGIEHNRYGSQWQSRSPTPIKNLWNRTSYQAYRQWLSDRSDIRWFFLQMRQIYSTLPTQTNQLAYMKHRISTHTAKTHTQSEWETNLFESKTRSKNNITKILELNGIAGKIQTVTGAHSYEIAHWGRQQHTISMKIKRSNK